MNLYVASRQPRVTVMNHTYWFSLNMDSMHLFSLVTWQFNHPQYSPTFFPVPSPCLLFRFSALHSWGCHLQHGMVFLSSSPSLSHPSCSNPLLPWLLVSFPGEDEGRPVHWGRRGSGRGGDLPQPRRWERDEEHIPYGSIEMHIPHHFSYYHDWCAPLPFLLKHTICSVLAICLRKNTGTGMWWMLEAGC